MTPTTPRPHNGTKCFKEKVDISKVNKIFLKRWLIDSLHEHVPDDDIAVEFLFELLIGADQGSPDIATIRQYTDEILGAKDSRDFCVSMWNLLLGAQQTKNGIPKEILEAKMKAMDKADAQRSTGEECFERTSPCSISDKPETRGISSLTSKADDNRSTLVSESDKKALAETKHILEAFKPKGSKIKGRVEKPKRTVHDNKCYNNDSHTTGSKKTHHSRSQSKTHNKTNYNRG